MYPIKDFKHKAFIEAAEELLRSDETLMALKLLDMVPGFYRDHKIPEIENLKREVRAKIATASFYATHEGFELTVDDNFCLQTAGSLRNQLIANDVRVLNQNGFHPQVFDMGPGEGALPVILKAQGLKFTYTQIYVNQPTYKATRRRFEDVEDKPTTLEIQQPPKIFVATEVIEHLHCEEEIRFEMDQRVGMADIVHVSTPLYTFAPNVMNWREIGWLGHLRTYTPEEFRTTVAKMFSEYQYAYYQSHVQHMRMWNPNSKFDCVKVNYQIEGL